MYTPHAFGEPEIKASDSGVMRELVLSDYRVVNLC